VVGGIKQDIKNDTFSGFQLWRKRGFVPLFL
jgi:hypothetical protein